MLYFRNGVNNGTLGQSNTKLCDCVKNIFMKSYEKLLKLAIDGKLPKNISEDDFPDIDMFVELYNRGFIDAIDASTLDGKAYINPKITFEGREYYNSLERTTTQPMTNSKKETKKVFISYVRENYDKVAQVCNKFSDEGIDYWIDRENIEPGILWKIAIKNAISKGAYFLACFSKQYAEKPEPYMNEEILLAIDILRKKPLDSGWFIPIKLNTCNIPNYEIGGGKYLHDIQYLDFTKDWDSNINKLVEKIRSTNYGIPCLRNHPINDLSVGEINRMLKKNCFFL